MAELSIQIKKKTDGSAALSCRRANGSMTWQRQVGVRGQFFPLHDLTHYAVETVLKFQQGFFGLVAQGWDFGDFDKPWPRGRIPEEGILAEVIVGMLDTERAGGEMMSAAELKGHMEKYFTEHGGTGRCEVTDQELEAIRAKRGELFAKWRELPEGETMELRFNAKQESAPDSLHIKGKS